MAGVAMGVRPVSAQMVTSPVAPIKANGLLAPPTPTNVRVTNYLHDLATPRAFLGVVGGGVLEQLLHKPSSWDDDGDGFARRIGSRATQTAVQVSVRHSVAALMHRSTGYQPCHCSGFGPKIGHALAETFTDHRADGSRAFSLPTVAGAYAGGLSRLAWEPQLSIGHVALSTTLSFGLTALFNIAGELTGLRR